MSEQRSKEELLDIFEEWVDQTTECWQCEYEAWDNLIEENQINEDEWETLQSFSMGSYYNHMKNRIEGV